MDRSLDPSMRLIGFSGKDVLKEGFDAALQNKDNDNLLSFVTKFQSVHGLSGLSIDPVIPMLKMAGMPTKRIATEILAHLIEIMKRQIATLDQEQLDAVLEQCYTYLTVPELAPVGIAVLERSRFVDPDIWAQIVQHGLDESPYTDLPLSIRKRIWAFEPSAFEHEVTKIIERAPEPEPPLTLEHLIPTLERVQQRKENPVVKDLLRLIHGSEDDLTAIVVEKFVEIATKEQSTAKRSGIANLLHDFLMVLTPKSGQTLNENLVAIRKMAKFLDGGADISTDEAQLKHIREAIESEISSGAVALIVASHYSRDYLADQLIGALISRRGPVGNGENPDVMSDAADHLRADPWIGDLTFLSLCNMRVGPLLAEGKLPHEDAEASFKAFYPLMIGEMESDTSRFEDDYFTANGLLPNKKLKDMVMKDWLARRVVTSYCLSLCVHGNVVGLSRFRMLLDSCYSGGDASEEVRESALAFHLLTKTMEEMYSSRQA